MVIGIIGVISTCLTLVYVQCIEKVRESVCKRNCLSLERLYEAELVGENNGHSDVKFEQFLFKQKGVFCPSGGIVIYVDKKVVCSVHCDIDKEDEIPII